MLRINLLRNLPKASDAPDAPSPTSAESPKPVKPLRIILPGFLIAAVAVALWLQPDWSGTGFVRDAAPSRADSMRTALEHEASRIVLEQQSAAINWLYELEALVPPETEIARAVFLPPGRFQLRGTVSSDAALTRIQESLVLLPGMTLRLSQSSALGDGDGFRFLFSGSLAFPDGDLPRPGNRVVDSRRLDAAMDDLLTRARLAEIDFNTPEPGDATASSYLRAHPWKITAICEIAVLRAFLNAERHGGSPFGIRRLTLEQKAGETTVSLDILAFAR